jgi:phage terminase small subunit
MAIRKASKRAAAKKPRKPSVRQEKLVEGVLQGKSKRRAALDAGYAESTASVDVYKMLEKPSIQARIRERIREAQIDTNEIIGTLVSHMRGDFADLLPEDEFFKEARRRGVSHLIRELETTEHIIPGEDGGPDVTERKRKIKIHDSQAAAKQLCNVFGLEKLPAPNPETARKLDEAVGKFIERAAAKGLKVTPEQARKKLQPYFETGGVNN